MTTLFTESEAERRKLSAHALLEARRDVWVLRGRRALLLKLLTNGTATADDVRDVVQLPEGIGPKLFGAVPGELRRAGIIRRTGYAPSRRPAGHARPVIQWELADRQKAAAWLARHADPDERGNDNGRDAATPGR